MRKLRALERPKQLELASEFHWLASVHVLEVPAGVNTAMLSPFDHCLSESEALKLLPADSEKEQFRRDSCFTALFERICCETEILPFVWRGRDKKTLQFRTFTSSTAANRYLRQDGARASDCPYLQFALPALAIIYYQGYDDNGHVYFTDPTQFDTFTGWVSDAHLYVYS